MATANSSQTNSGDDGSGGDVSTETPVAATSDASNSILNPASPFPLICFHKLAFNSAGGAITGSVLGYGVGLWNKKGFKGSFVFAQSFAKEMAVMCGVHNLVVCLLKRHRGKDDAINHGIAGCCAGIAMKFPGPPEALLQSCLTMGALSFFIDGWNKPVRAQSFYSKTSVHYTTRLPALALSLQLPLPNEMKGAFSDFHQSLKQRSKATFPISH